MTPQFIECSIHRHCP